MLQKLRTFSASESGAVSADWVVITAAIMLFAGATATTIKTSTETAGENIGTQVAEMATP